MKTPKEAPSKLNLRMPQALRAEAEAQAAAMGVSLNAYCLLALRNFIPYTAKQNPIQAPPVRSTGVAKPTSVPARSSSAAAWPKVGRNDLCPCGSGRKAKHCHPEAC